MNKEKLSEEGLNESKEEYKDSKDARFKKEAGDPDEDVIVKDKFNNGETITFVWKRGKSNENVDDTGGEKGGFSFYQARFVNRDPYLQKGSIKTSNPGGLSIVGTVFEDDEEAIIVIQEKEEGKDEEGDPVIRIFSATYSNDSVQLYYFRRLFRRHSVKLKHLEESSGDNDLIARTTLEHRKIPEKPQQYTPNQPINTVEGFERALWYVEDQLHKISFLIRKVIDNDITIKFYITDKLTESEISDVFKLYSETAEKTRECENNIDLTIVRIQESLQYSKLSPDSLVFEIIDKETYTIEKYSNRYNRTIVKSNYELPKIDELCQNYLESIVKLNFAIESTNIQVRYPEFEKGLNEDTLEKLTERFIPAKMNELNAAMKRDSELDEFINMPGYLLPKHYHFLIRELNVKNRKSTLLDIIKMSKAGGYKTLFSIANDKIIGFVAYKVEENSITEVKIFSLKPKVYNNVLIGGLDRFLTENLKKYKTIQWMAMKENPDCKIFEDARIRHNGKRFPWKDPLTDEIDEEVWLYHFEGMKP